MIKNLFIFLCILMFSVPVFSQFVLPNISSEEEKKIMAKLDEGDPQFAQFQKRLMKIGKDISTIVQNYRKGRLSKDDAKEKLEPLIREQIAIINNPDFLVAQQISAFLSDK